MEQFVQNLQREAKKMFESDEYAHQRQEMIEQIQKKQQEMMEGLMEEANRSGFTLRMTPSGIVLLPTKDGKPMQEADYLALPTAEKKRLEEKRGEIEKKVEDAMREGRKLEREIGEKLEAAETRAADYLVRIPLADLKEKYREYPKVVAYLDGVRDHILKNLGRFKGAERRAQCGGAGTDAIRRAAHRSVFALSSQRVRRQQRHAGAADHRRNQSDLSQSCSASSKKSQSSAVTSPISP